LLLAGCRHISQITAIGWFTCFRSDKYLVTENMYMHRPNGGGLWALKEVHQKVWDLAKLQGCGYAVIGS